MSVFLDIDPGDWIAHNALAFAIRDAYPVTDGHSLAIPRREIATWWEATADEQRALMDLVEDVKRQLDAEFEPDGYNVGFNAGAAAGQTVPHLHLHVIPRHLGDMDDPRGGVRHVIPARGNYLAAPAAAESVLPRPTALVTAADGGLRRSLVRAFNRPGVDRIDLLVSFVMRSGVDLIADHLDTALERGANVRLLTTDYLNITDSNALGFFLDRQQQLPERLEVRVFADPTTSFHPKAYIFASAAEDDVAFVGSSNLSRSGISAGVEWNLEVDDVEHLVAEFEELWNDRRTVPLSGRWLAAYHERWTESRRSPQAASDPETEAIAAAEVIDEGGAPEPWSVQREAMAALEATRQDGHKAGLVVMATGLGKTWLAAFDSRRPRFRRFLFVAHRDEILTQARDTFRQTRPDAELTMFTGSDRDPDGDGVFASVQSLHNNLDRFDPEAFDYVVIDEFHHASADTYRKVIAHFRPDFMLGLTATPDRADSADLLALCGDNLVYDCGLVEGVRRELLSPFTYRAIPDVADYEHIPWRNGRFDQARLGEELATQDRAGQVLDEWRRAGGAERRTLGFCATIAHAEFMADFFRHNGETAVAVHSQPGSADRVEALEDLASGATPIVFTVDLFNEGVDVPAIDLVLFLRPTESPIVFFQQLGRGLRRADGKERLDVIDLVGNHRSFLLKARLLAALTGRPHLTDREALDRLADENPELPSGCGIVVEPEVVDLLRTLVRSTREDNLFELIEQWRDDHEGRRPTALEIAVVTGKAHNRKKDGGWFGFLARHEVLDDVDRAVADLAGEFLVWIEHGSYTKSYKLVTLQALLQAGSLRAGISIAELAPLTRWLVYRDSQLLADLSDVNTGFVDVTDPTNAEWTAYWRKNPISALTRSGASSPWFAVEDDRLTFALDVPDELGATFDRMVNEIVGYRLHRYLVEQKTRLVGESRKPMHDGSELDATFVVETTWGTPTSVVIESAGSGRSRNKDYVAGFDRVLERIAALDCVLLDAHIDTASTRNVPLADRRLDPGEAHAYPISLRRVVDLVGLRAQLLRSMSRVGRAPGAKGSGNARKQTRLVLEVPGQWTVGELADLLASGEAEQRGPTSPRIGEPASAFRP